MFLVDDDINKQGKKLEGHDVMSNMNLKEYDIEAVIITSCVYEKKIRDKLRKLNYPEEKIVSFFNID